MIEDWMKDLYVKEYMKEVEDAMKDLTIKKEIEDLKDGTDLGYRNNDEGNQDPPSGNKKPE